MKANTQIKANTKTTMSPVAKVISIYKRLTGYRSQKDKKELWPELPLEKDQYASIKSIDAIL